MFLIIFPVQFKAENFQPRNRETHARHIHQLGGPLQSHIATTYGIHVDSVLNSLRYFHVTEGETAERRATAECELEETLSRSPLRGPRLSRGYGCACKTLPRLTL